jgi:hypothetical protein
MKKFHSHAHVLITTVTVHLKHMTGMINDETQGDESDVCEEDGPPFIAGRPTALQPTPTDVYKEA